MENKGLSFFEKTAFNNNSSFQDKKKIAELKKEIELLKEEMEKQSLLNDDVKVISTAEDFIQLCENLPIECKLKLIAGLNQSIKKQQSNVKDDILDKTRYIAKRLFKSRPAKKEALINSIKTIFQFQNGITDSEIDEIIFDLQKRSFIKIVNDKITYL